MAKLSGGGELESIQDESENLSRTAYHRLPDRIKAHASICFIALILYRVMRQRLHAADAKTSPEKALAQLRRIQHHRITLNGSQPSAGLSTNSSEHTRILTALNIEKPRLPEQLTLL